MRKFLLSLNLLLFGNILLSQEGEFSVSNLELAVFNNSTSEIEVILYPVSSIYNGLNKYSLISKNRFHNHLYNYDYNTGVYMNIPSLKIQYLISYPGMNGWDTDLDQEANPGSFGEMNFGIYKLVIRNLSTGRIDSALIEFDYAANSAQTPGDLYFYLFPDNNPHPQFGRFYYNFDNQNIIPDNFNVPIFYSSIEGYTVKSYKPNSYISNYMARDKRFGPLGGFTYQIENEVYNYYSTFPLDARRDCGRINSSLNFLYNQNHKYPPNYSVDPDPIFYESNFEERHGVVPLNIIIMKNITTPTSRWEYSQTSTPTNISILPGVTFAIDKGQTGNATTYTEFLLKNYSDGTGTKFIVNGNNEEFSGATLKLLHSDVYETNARMRFQQDCELVLKPQSNTILEKYGNLIFENGGEMYMEQNSNLTFYDHGEIIINSGGKVYNCGANITNNSNVCIIAHQGGQYFIGSQYCNTNVTHTFNNGAFLVLNGGDLYISDNSKIIFDGHNSFLNAKPNSHIYLGQNAKLEFKNGAYLKAESVTFLTEGGDISEGLVFENAGGLTEIKNCTFTNAKNPIRIINDSASAYSNKKITGSTFNMPALTGNAIYAENVFKILVQNNTFNLSSPTNNQIGLYIRNNYNAGYPSEAPPTPLYQLNIMSNSFSSGTIGMALMNTAGIMIPYYVYDNRFIGTSSGYYGIIGKKMTGTIKNTKFNNVHINQGIRLDISDVDLFGNIITGNQDNLKINGLSNVRMEPIINGVNYNWTGGRNKMNSKYASNLNFDYSNLPLLNFGENCFELQSTSTGSHLLGTAYNILSPYNCKYNGWTNTSGVQLSNITFNGNLIVPYITPLISCNTTPTYDSYSYIDKGFDIFDTVGVSARQDTTTIPDDEALFAQGYYYSEEADWTSAIVSYKQLIDNHINSTTLVETVWTLYSCYTQLDTSQNETYRDDLYSECKTYLTNKINSGNYQTQVTDAAYQVILMCDAIIGKYNDALDGYEFIINFHPDPVVRINASWDYEDIAALLGEGGAQRSDNQTYEQYIKKNLKKLKQKYNRDPLKKELLKRYDSEVIEKYNNKNETDNIQRHTKKDISITERGNIEKKIYTPLQQKVIQKSIENILRSRNRTTEQKQQSLIEDLVLSGGIEVNNDNIETTGIIPEEYKLYQNYPNPFNPVTSISYQIPIDGLVKLKVYDILGKEVTTLVNEVKQAGSYQVTFNGSNLSSGVYFYKIESGRFSQVKRMVLIK